MYNPVKLPAGASVLELKPVTAVDRAKSFYGKAKLWLFRPGVWVLLSYGTAVFTIDFNRGTICRVWDGYSRTTMRHVNSCLAFFHLPGGGKTFWDALPVGIDVQTFRGWGDDQC